MTATKCVDCDAAIPPTLDVPLCDNDLRVAVAVVGSGEARVKLRADYDERAGKC